MTQSHDDAPRPDPEDPGADDAAGGDGTPALDPAAQAQLDDLQARYLRLAADFENHRRRAARDLADRGRYGAEAAALALLPVLDNLRRAVDSAPADTQAGLLDGLRYTVRQFEEALAGVGVTVIEAVGAPFDPSLHQAVMGEESEDVEVDTVLADLQHGYRLHDRVLRPSMVKVAHPAHPATPFSEV